MKKGVHHWSPLLALLFVVFNRRIRFLTEGKCAMIISYSSCMFCCFTCCFTCCRLFLWHSLRNGIISAASPGIASQDSLQWQIETFERPIFPECLECILWTCRGKSAARSLVRRDACPVEFDENDEGKVQDFPYSFLFHEPHEFNLCIISSIAADISS